MISRLVLLSAVPALFVACKPAEPDPVEVPKPTVWGPQALVDQDPDFNVVEVVLTADEATVDWLDAGATPVWSYNGVVPGPIIQAWVGDTVRVIFTNNLDEPTTIHWHGLRIDNLMDGVPAIQDPVQPGETFIYEFVVPDAGSFWYHPHMRSDVQIESGLQGTLVVHEREPLPYDMDRYFVIDDVLLTDTGAPVAFRPMNHMSQMRGRHGNVLLVNGKSDPVSDTMQRGTRERWRVVNTANARSMWIDVEGADWRVIAIDGTLLQTPLIGDERKLLPVGRRFDIEVINKSDADEVQLQVELPNRDGGFSEFPMYTGTLQGEAAPPAFLDWVAPALPAMKPTTQEVILEFNGENGGSGLRWTINGKTYDEADDIVVKRDTPTKLIIKERSGAEHPFHLHGQFFRLVDRGNRTTMPMVPGQMDTVLVAGDETVQLYTEFENPGRWMAHCHILEHAESGMMVEIVVEE